METVKSFLKREPVLVISGLLAAASVFLVPPSAEYLSYIDLRTLGILFCLMAAVAGLTDAGLFALLVRKLSAGVGTVRKLCLLLTGACFLFSMFITNDVALLTFVPLTIALLAGEGQRTLILAVVSETIAANLGSALTPFGNPQNLFLYSRYGMGLGEFFRVTGPICLLGFLLTFGGLLLARPENAPLALPGGAGEERPFSGRRAAFSQRCSCSACWLSCGCSTGGSPLQRRFSCWPSLRGRSSGGSITAFCSPSSSFSSWWAICPASRPSVPGSLPSWPGGKRPFQPW